MILIILFILSVRPVSLPHVTSVVPYAPGTLQVQQAGLFSEASTNGAEVLQ